MNDIISVTTVFWPFFWRLHSSSCTSGMNISFWQFRHKGFSIKIEVFSLLFAFILGEANVDWLDDNEVLYIDIEAVMDVSSLMFVSFDRIIISQPSNSDDESRSSLRAESQYDSVLTEIKSRYSLSFWE